jgi:SAM-dependent methyltransferase
VDQHLDYGPEYYEHYSDLRSADDQAPPPYRCGEPIWEQSFAAKAREITARLAPRTVLDAGCAIGFLVQALRREGVEAYGVDVSEWAISQVPEAIRPHCWEGSIAAELERDYDLITCIEVLEHLPGDEARAAVANLCRHTSRVLFSSTPDHFDEVTHVNVRPPEYWAALFAAHGFVRDVDFDATFISPHAVLFQKGLSLTSAVAAYERWAGLIHRELAGVRQHRDYLYSEVLELRRKSSAATAELEALQATKTFRLSRGLRRLWARTGGRGPKTP